MNHPAPSLQSFTFTFPFRRCAIRAIIGGFLLLVVAAAAYSQQITCPVTASTTNTSTTATNGLNPCEITTGGALTNSSGATLENQTGATLLNDSGATLTNEGSLLNDVGGTLTNNGLLTNNSSITSSGTINNSGTLNGNGTIFTSGTVNNSGVFEAAFYTFGGTINNTGGGTLGLTGGLIQGGTLNNVSGYLGTIDSTATLDGSTGFGAVTIQGTYTVGGFHTQVLGTLNNQGNVVADFGRLTLAGDTTLQGGGTVTLAGSGSFIDGSHTLTNVDNTIQGAGQIGDTTNGSPTLVNQGTINANVSGETLKVGALFANNSGLMEATNGGTLELDGTVIFSRPGGTIAANGGTVFLAVADIVGGTLNNVSGYLGTIDSTATLDGSTGFGAVTIQGTYTVGGFHTQVLGTLNNQGNVADFGRLTLAGDTTLQGGGTVTLGGSGSFIDGSHTLTNVDNTIQGAGQIGDATNGSPTLINQAGGTINANVSGQVLEFFGVQTSNAGVLEATGGGILSLKASPLTNTGTVQVDAGSALQVIAPFTQTGGKTQVDGTLLAGFGLNVSGGSVLGTGTINGDVAMIGGKMQPGELTTPGTLTMNGNYSQTNATFDELIGATGNGLLIVNGTSTLGPGALLNIDFVGNFTPTLGESFTLMDYFSGSGQFANAPTTGFEMDGWDWLIDYNPNDIVLIAESVEEGGGGGGGGGGGTNVPEPSSLLLLTSILLPLCGYLRWKKSAARSGGQAVLVT